MAMALDESAERIRKDRDLIFQNMCPVCERSTGKARNPRRALMHHVNKISDPEHKLWKDIFWKVHFCYGGYNYRPQKRTIPEIVDIIEKYFGDDFGNFLASRGVVVE